MIYLDHAATTPLTPTLVPSLVDATFEFFGNNSSNHGWGRKSQETLDTARKKVADLLGVASNAFYFSSGATESINIILQGYAKHLQLLKSPRSTVVVSTIEHPAVYNTARHLETLGFEIIEVSPNSSGVITAQSLQTHLSETTAMVLIMHVNNETGAIQPVNELAEAVKSYDKEIFFFCDAVQALGKLSYPYDTSSIDALVMSGHKFGGPKGIGGFYINPRFRIQPICYGGKQEHTYHPGTVNVPGAHLMAAALEYAYEHYTLHQAHAVELNTFLEEQFNKHRISYTRLIPAELSSPYICSVVIPARRSELLIEELSSREIYISSKSACSSGSHTKSRILESMKVPLDQIDNVLRISFAPTTTKEELTTFATTLASILSS